MISLASLRHGALVILNVCNKPHRDLRSARLQTLLWTGATCFFVHLRGAVIPAPLVPRESSGGILARRGTSESRLVRELTFNGATTRSLLNDSKKLPLGHTYPLAGVSIRVQMIRVYLFFLGDFRFWPDFGPRFFGTVSFP